MPACFGKATPTDGSVYGEPNVKQTKRAMLILGLCGTVAAAQDAAKKSTEDIRGQAQGFLVLVTYGVGMLLGAQVSGWVFNGIVPEPTVLPAWQPFWYLPAAFAAAVLLFFGASFRETASSTS